MSLLLVGATLAGCVSPEDAPLDAATADDAQDAPAVALLQEPTVVAALRFGTGYEFSFACILGEGPDLPREAPILAGATTLRITVDPGASNGIRAGYSFNDSDFVWLPVVTGLAQSFDVPVGPGEHETEPDLWVFRYQPNLPEPATQDCYNGAAVGPHSVVVEALPG